ncbi:class III lanthionine synthetase LanKC [Schumannella luteola]|uniref:Serine/threonine protein kinase n=1 Tax=Schumannella luteola TaxID=472059 RepID=A0A852YF33_9MICO|nr:serine/threonine protein kinase [Schumannella luteola]
MDGQLEIYAGVDPFFFREPDLAVDTTPEFELQVPAGWRRETGFEWTHLVNPSAVLPTQGWKIHVSTTPSDARRTLDLVAEFCFREGVPFKHLSTEGRLLARNGKTTPRQHAGKFVTCYPTEAQLESMLIGLESALAGQSGPYILSDRRWASSPVYLRYGVFVPRDAEETPLGLVAYLNGADGSREADERTVAFHVPEWLENPPFIEAWLARSNSDDIELPFEISRAVKFSTAGGTYRGSHADRPVIIKEARAHSGHDFMGRSASDRLANEADALAELSEVEAVPTVRWRGRLWENDFVALDERPGLVLRKWVIGNYPAYASGADDFERYFSGALLVAQNLIKALEQMHGAGWAHQDVHPDNILVAEDLSVALIDFECAARTSSGEREHVIAGSGFRAPGLRTPEQIDWYGARQILAFVTVPLIVQSELVTDYSFQTRRFLSEHLRRSGLRIAAVDSLLALLAELDRRAHVGAPTDRAESTDHWRLSALATSDEPSSWAESVASGLAETRARSDDPASSSHPHGLPHRGLGLSYGAAGLVTVFTARTSRSAHDLSGYTKALIKRITEREGAPARHGLFDGNAGDIWAKFRAQPAEFVLAASDFDRMISAPGRRLYDGRPGTLLALIGMAREGVLDPDQEAASKDAVMSIATEYVDSPGLFAPRGKNRTNKGNRPEHFTSGLLYGHLGVAWLMSRAWTLFGDSRALDACNRALLEELAGYDYDPTSVTLQLREGNRSIPYLASGSAGFGVVLERLERADLDPTIVEAAPALLNATRPLLTVFPGLFEGAAGLAVGRLGLQRFLDVPLDGPEVLARNLALFAIRSESGIVFAGDSGLRITTDVATGGAGILHALDLQERGSAQLLDL